MKTIRATATATRTIIKMISIALTSGLASGQSSNGNEVVSSAGASSANRPHCSQDEAARQGHRQRRHRPAFDYPLCGRLDVMGEDLEVITHLLRVVRNGLSRAL